MAMAARPGQGQGPSLTSWLDPALDYFAKQAGIPTDQYVSQVGGEGIGNVLELTAELFTKGWLTKAIQFTAGLIADVYAIWGRDVPVRLRRELLALGTHELLRIIYLAPSELQQLQGSAQASIQAIRRGDLNGFLSTVLKSPQELGLPMPAGQAAPQAVVVGPTPAPAPTPTPTQVAPPAPQQPPAPVF